MNREQLYEQEQKSFKRLLVIVLRKLALKPSDLLPTSRKAVQAASVAQLRQLCKEDADYYLDKKCAKLQIRRQGLISQVAREYQLMRKSRTFEVQFARLSSDTEVTKRRHVPRYHEIHKQQCLFKNFERRLRVQRRLKLQEASQRIYKKRAEKDLMRKLSAASSRRQQYKLELLRSSQNKSAELHHRKIQSLRQQQLQRSEQLREHLMEKLDRVSKSREQRQRQNEMILHYRNSSVQEKVKSIKRTSINVQIKQMKQLKNTISKTIQSHLKNKNKIINSKIKKIHSIRSVEDKKISKIKVEFKKREEMQHEYFLHNLNKKQQQVEQNKQQIRHQLQQKIRQQQRSRESRLEQVERRRSMVDIGSDKRRNFIYKRSLPYTNTEVFQKKRPIDDKKRRAHINQEIKIQLLALNLKRQNEMEEFKKEEVRQKLNKMDIKNKELQKNKNRLQQNRQKLKIVTQSRNQSLGRYFQSRIKKNKDPTSYTNCDNFFSETPKDDSVDLEMLNNYKSFVP